MTVRIITADVFDGLRELEPESVDCVITSPPYWGLRSYLADDDPLKPCEIGLERTLGEHLDRLVAVFAEVWRVLKPTGTCWVNYGDCYATTMNGRSAADYKALGQDDRTFRDKPFSTIGPIHPPEPGQPFPDVDRRGGGNAVGPVYDPAGGKHGTGGRGTLKPKDLCMVANRLAIALQDWGWWVRSEIIWHKPNPMPESIRDRPATSHEKVWMLAKAERYFYDAEAVRVLGSTDTHARTARYAQPSAPDKIKSPYGQGFTRRAKAAQEAKGRGVDPRHDGQINHTTLDQDGPRAPGVTPKSAPPGSGIKANDSFQAAISPEVLPTRNLRNVWSIPTAPFPEAHFATFPPALVELCLKAGTSAKGNCAICGAPWVRVIEATGAINHRDRESNTCDFIPGVTQGGNASGIRSLSGATYQRQRIGRGDWQPSCACGTLDVMPALVLDPFGGSGTVGIVAQRLGRDAVLIDLNADYTAMADRRIHVDRQPGRADRVRRKMPKDQHDLFAEGDDDGDAATDELGGGNGGGADAGDGAQAVDAGAEAECLAVGGGEAGDHQHRRGS